MTNNSKVTGSISVSFNDQKNSLSKEPTGDVKKEYWVGCYSKEDWEFIHEELKKDGSLEDNIPTESCECCNDCLQSEVRGMYLLTDTEVNDLKNHPRVKYVHIHAMAYPGTYMDDPDISSASFSKTERYSSTVKHKRDMFDNPNDYFSNPPQNNDLINKGSWQLMRHIQKIDPWYGINDNTIINNKIEQYGTGVDIDLIVCDTDMWFGHIEFQNPSSITSIKQGDNTTATTTSGPSNYVGTNLLKSGFATSATTGTCGVLDVLLEGPYYIDPAWFEADTTNRLEARWDGTTVPKESVAREWWSDASKRSAAFSSVGTIPSSSMTLYTRTRCNGTNTAYNTGGETHGTPCASQAYGREYGWAYNANKWFLNLYGTNSVGFEVGFDLQKIFHVNKPNRSSDDTKNPTISSNSWGRRFNASTLGSSGYYYFRPATTDGTTTGVQYTSWDMDGDTNGSGGSAPRFMTNRTLDSWGSGVQCEPVSGATMTAANEMTAAGVIFVVAAGNHNQKMVKSTHGDYNNYVGSNDDSSLSSTQFYYASDGLTYHKTLDRGGFPQAFNNAINIGALDHVFGSGKGRKVNYSSTGDLVDCYAVADDSLASCDNRSSGYARYDSFYTYDSSQSVLSYDRIFNGTSSACPIAVGLIATKLQYNRTWTSSDIKSWLTSTVGQQNAADFYYGTDSTTVNDTNWSDQNSIQGGAGIVPYDTPVSDPEPDPDPTTLSAGIITKFNPGEGLTLTGSSGLTIKKLT